MATIEKNLSGYDPVSVPSAEGFKFGIVVSEWNEQVTTALSEGAIHTLLSHGVHRENIILEMVPGSFELPLGAQIIIEKHKPDAVILIGCVIRGETSHFDFICQAVAAGCMEVGLKYHLPAVFGVLTTENMVQAMDRAGGKHGNKGIEAAVTAIRMAAYVKR